MSEQDEPSELTEWEQGAAAALHAAHLPLWESKARAATYAQGHRGILDLNLDFPKEYLKCPAPECYVWKTEVAEGTRVHAYADVEGNQFHLLWAEQSKTGPQNQPTHESGPCANTTCKECEAARLIARMCTAV